MDDTGFGVVVRTARIRRGWRQRDLASAVGVSDAVISRLERGHLDGISLGTIRAVARAVEIRVELLPKSRSANLERLVRAKHAALAEAVIRWLGGFGGWVVRPEVSFAIYGERGVVDLLAWHAGRRALVLFELKTAIVDVGEILATLDRKVRHARAIARDLGWDPLTVSVVLVIAEGSTSRRRVEGHAATFAAALPDRVVAVRRLLSAPSADVCAPGVRAANVRAPGMRAADVRAESVRALVFFSDRREGQVVQRLAHRERVTVRRDQARDRPPTAAPARTGANGQAASVDRDPARPHPTILTARRAGRAT